MPDTPNSLRNTYYQRENHILLGMDAMNQEVIFDAAQVLAASLGKTIALIADPVSDNFDSTTVSFDDTSLTFDRSL